MAASSKTSARKGESSTSKTPKSGPQPIQAEEAVQLLQSSIAYMQMAGLSVLAQNNINGLVLTVPGVIYVTNADASKAEFRIGAIADVEIGDPEPVEQPDAAEP